MMNNANYYVPTHQQQVGQVQASTNPQQLQELQAKALMQDYRKQQLQQQQQQIQQQQQQPPNLAQQHQHQPHQQQHQQQVSSGSSRPTSAAGQPGPVDANGRPFNQQMAVSQLAASQMTPSQLIASPRIQRQQAQFPMYNNQYQARPGAQPNSAALAQLHLIQQRQQQRPNTTGGSTPTANGGALPLHTPQQHQVPTPTQQQHPPNNSVNIAQMRRGAGITMGTPGSLSSPMSRTTSGGIPHDFSMPSSQQLPATQSIASFNGTPSIARAIVGNPSIPSASMSQMSMLQQQHQQHQQLRATTVSLPGAAPMPQHQQLQANSGLGNLTGAALSSLSQMSNSGKMLPPPMRVQKSPPPGPPFLTNGSTAIPPPLAQQMPPPPPPPSIVQPIMPGALSGPFSSDHPSHLGQPQGQPLSLLQQLAQIEAIQRQQSSQPATQAPLKPLQLPASTSLPTTAISKQHHLLAGHHMLPPGARPKPGGLTTRNQAVVVQTLSQIHPALRAVNQGVTQVRVLPVPTSPSDTTHGGTLPTLTDMDLARVKGFMKMDETYEITWRESRERMDTELEEVGGKSKWWEKDISIPDVGGEDRRSRMDLLWPSESRRAREKRKDRKEIKLPRPSRAAARKPEELIPIRIEIEHEHQRLRETFVWNLNDPLVTPELFAQTTCDDLDLPSAFVTQFAAQVKQQLSEYSMHKLEFPSPMDVDNDDTKNAVLIRGKLAPEDEIWWSRWRKRLRVDEEGGFVGMDVDEKSTPVADEEKINNPALSPLVTPKVGKTKKTPIPAEDPDESKPSIDVDSDDEDEINYELRILIKLDITVGSINLSDQFEWDVNDVDNSPETFAEVYACDLGLTGDFKTAIAHSIREQVHVHQKSLAIIGHPFDGTSVQDEDLKSAFLPVVKKATRTLDDSDSYMPVLHHLTESEIERVEKEREKEIKRKKRQGRARTRLAMPDRDPLKTQRTIPGATEVHNGMPPPSTVTIGSSRRAAAQAASATIASLAASENSDRPYGALLPPVIHVDRHAQQAPTPPAIVPPPKPTKRQKVVHLRAPTLPQDVYTPRAKLSLSHRTASTSLRPPAPARSVKKNRGDGEASSSARTPSATPVKQTPTSRAAAAKEMNDAKIKEYAEGLHPVMINGKWHCSVCGCPEDIAIGRRKGPLGEKTMCGDCGKYYHRHRRPNDAVEYNTDPEFHLAKRGGARIAAAAMAAAAATAETPVSLPPADTPMSSEDEDEDDEEDVPLATRNRSKQSSVNRILSPELSDPESVKVETPPRTAQVQPPPPPSPPVPPPERYRSQHQHGLVPAQSPTKSPVISDGHLSNGGPAPSVSSQASPIIPSRSKLNRARILFPPGTPQWLQDCLERTKAAHPADDFGALPRPPQPGADPATPPEWRLKCYDCPGKLYTPGPDQTLENFIVHLRNRQHRANVSKRIAQQAAEAGIPPADPQPSTS
ncbi:hypothetical protein BS47DRAFT_1341372 [Hydnum rufescens UP504]|uniref:SNF5-domain-containing protein n=1 Tax=Hydnum rufescens UP504 TaxID=1448309 RepID=A0A9P6B326_9AGAM|nr:hypothetical protein BS47DRAFT_1341372 [Hydnum rufescens UP504]